MEIIKIFILYKILSVDIFDVIFYDFDKESKNINENSDFIKYISFLND